MTLMRMKTLGAVIGCLLLWQAQAPGAFFEQVNKDGFGNPHNMGELKVKTMAVFQDRLCAGISNQVEGAQVWAYDGAAWQQINESGFGSKLNTAVACLTATSTMLYAGTANRDGGEVWAYDGREWRCLHAGRFGSTLGTIIQSMAVYQGRLYVGIWDQATSTPAEVWAYDGSASWQLVNSPGFGTPVNICTIALEASAVDGAEKLYALIWKSFQYKGPDAGCEVWAYDGTAWNKVNAGREGFGEPGKGRSGVEAFSVAEFQGKLYVGLWGFENIGWWEVWAYDGREWKIANRDVRDRGKFLMLCLALTVYQDRLYAVVTDGYREFELWASDGTRWDKIIGQGCTAPEQLGDPANKTINSMAVYRGDLYAGVVNERAGYRVYQSRFPEIVPQAAKLAAGDEELFKLSDAGIPVSWNSSNPEVATIDPRTGLVQARAAGVTSLAATDSHGLRVAHVQLEIAKKKKAKKKQDVMIYTEAMPRAVYNDGAGQVLATARIYLPGGSGEVKSVSGDFSSLGAGTLALYDDGTHGDRSAGDQVYSCSIAIPKDAAPRSYEFEIAAGTTRGVTGTARLWLQVMQCYTKPEITGLRAMGAGFHIPVLFDLTDADGDVCSVMVEYQKEGGQWQPASIEARAGKVEIVKDNPAGGTRIIGLQTPRPVNPYLCVWQSEKDIGAGSGNYYLRLTPADGQSAGQAKMTGPISVNNQKPPADEMVLVAKGNFYIDKYEYPNKFGYFPEADLTWEQARKACQSQGKDLCTAGQWEAAYYGSSASKYPYGNTFGFEGRNFCNTHGAADGAPAPCGVYEHCCNDLGACDMGGNVYEWAGISTDQVFMADQAYLELPLMHSLVNVEDPAHRHPYLGFRCCKEAR